MAAKTSPRSTMVPPRRAPHEARDDPRCPGRDRARGGAMTPLLATVYPRALFRAHARHTTSGTLPEPLADDVPRGRPPTGADASWPVLGPLGTISNCFVLLGGGRPWSEPGPKRTWHVTEHTRTPLEGPLGRSTRGNMPAGDSRGQRRQAMEPLRSLTAPRLILRNRRRYGGRFSGMVC